MTTEKLMFRIFQLNGQETFDAGDFSPGEVRRRAHELSHAAAGACVEVFREQDPRDVVLYRVGKRDAGA